MANNRKVGGGMGFLQVLTTVFIVLKITNQIDWSWFWVLSPSIIPMIIMVIYIAWLFFPRFWRVKRSERRN